MARPRLLKFSLLGLASLLVILLIASIVLAVVLVRRPFPQNSGEVTIPGLRSTVTVQRDGHGIPQVYADNAEDLFRAQGYVQAQDQFFTMDWRRHVAAGRLSELVGPESYALTSDKLARTLGWRRTALAEEKQLDAATRGYLQAFTAGVNDYLTGRSASQLSLNYTVLSLRVPLGKIESWTVADSLAWFHAMAWQLRGDYDDELVRARVLASVKDPGRVEQLYPAYPYARHDTVVSLAPGRTPASSGGLAARSGSGSAAGTGATTAGSTGSGGTTKTGGTTTKSSKKRQTAEQAAAAAAARRGRQLDADSQVLERALLGGDAQAAVEQARQASSAAPEVLGSGRTMGANAWVVSGALTASGKPLLADDPQLAAGLPGAWYQMGLHCRTVAQGCPFDVTGYTFAGVPGIVVGHNARISWGLNSVGPDTTDYFLEKVSGDSYLRDGRQVPIETREETITVAGGDPVTFTVRSTVHGPILSDLAPPASTTTAGAGAAAGTGGQPGTAPHENPYAVSIGWAALQPGHNMQGILAMDAARDFASFRAAAQLVDTPAQTFVYADVDGHIGLQVAGHLPARRTATASSTAPEATGTGAGADATAGAGADATTGAGADATTGAGADATAGAGAGTSGGTSTGAAAARNAVTQVPRDGTWVLPGWNSGFDWAGFVPADQLPWALDPADGIIVAANQPIVGPSSGVQVAAAWDSGYRAQRVHDLIDARVRGGHKLTVSDVQAIQGDTYDPMAAQLVPLLLQVKTDSSFGFTAQARDLLKGWDYTQPADSAAAAYYNAVWAALLDLTFSDELPEGARPDGGQRWFEVVRGMLDDPRNAWWDDHRTPDVVEAEAQVLRQAMIQARLRLTSFLGKDPNRWEWGHLHRVQLTGRLGDLGVTSLLHPLLNQGPIEVGGGVSAVDAMAWDASSGTFDVADAPSLRMIVDLSDLDGSRWVNATGESAHPGSGHYTDQVNAWARNQSFAWPFGAEAVKRVTEDTLTLKGTG